MDRRGYQQYKQQAINSMTPGELLLLLYDELVKRGTMASIALDKKDYPVFEASVERCMDIINYLDETLDRKYDISRDLGRLYEQSCGTHSTPRKETTARERAVRYDGK